MEEAYPLRRTYSLNYRRPRLKFNILQHYLRGRGFTSYHIYEIEVSHSANIITITIINPLHACAQRGLL